MAAIRCATMRFDFAFFVLRLWFLSFSESLLNDDNKSVLRIRLFHLNFVHLKMVHVVNFSIETKKKNTIFKERENQFVAIVATYAYTYRHI